jgi:transcriptional regulator with GAF, ATPase, and Fis domain
LKKQATEAGRDLDDFSIGAMRKLMLYDWPGNVRALQNFIERAVVFAKGTSVESADLVLAESHENGDMESFRNAKARVVEPFERDYIRSLLLCHEGNISRHPNQLARTGGHSGNSFANMESTFKTSDPIFCKTFLYRNRRNLSSYKSPEFTQLSGIPAYRQG